MPEKRPWTMTQTAKIPIKVISVLLHFPDTDLWANLERLGAALENTAPGGLRDGLMDIVSRMREKTLLDLQEVYTEAFDLKPSATLNMTWHRHGDNDKRADALVRLQRVYASAGFECTTGDLPDYLPLMLEFLADAPEDRVPADAAGHVWEAMGNVADLAARVREAAPVYADLLTLLDRVRVERIATD